MRDLLPKRIYEAISNYNVSEIRVRLDKPIRYMVDGVYHTLYVDNELMLASKDDIEYILAVATSHSMYAYNDEIKRGYIAYRGGIRIGIAGVGVEEKGQLNTIKHINYLVIRVPCEIKGVADDIVHAVKSKRDNVLIIAPPCVGKTTMLRDYIRQISNSGLNVVLIDERSEIAGVSNGKAHLDVGSNTDVLSNISKSCAYEMATRSLSPDLIATDEIFGVAEINAVSDIVRAGISLVATIHAKSVELLQNTEYFRIISLFNTVVTLDFGYKNRIKSIEHIHV